MAHRIDSLKAPLFVSWQLTRDCDLACLHCCTDSAPGKRLPDRGVAFITGCAMREGIDLCCLLDITGVDADQRGAPSIAVCAAIK